MSNAVLAAIGTIVGLTPHVLRHIGLLAGTALVACASRRDAGHDCTTDGEDFVAPRRYGRP